MTNTNGKKLMDKINTDNGGLRYNEGKAPIHLIPPEVIEAHAEHYRKGAEKYKPRNWERGMDWTKCYDSLMRHALAWMRGEDIDPENGSHHMVAVMWNAAALYWYWLKKVGKDDRPRYQQPVEPYTPQEMLEKGLNNPKPPENILGDVAAGKYQYVPPKPLPTRTKIGW